MPKSGTHLLIKLAELAGFQSHGVKRRISQKILGKAGLSTPEGFAYGDIATNSKVNVYRALNIGKNDPKIPVDVTSPLYVPARVMRSWLSITPDYSYIPGHVPYSISMEAILHDLQYYHIVIVRDPRAVLVSFLKHMTRMKNKHPLHQDFMSLSASQRFYLALFGGYTPLKKRPLLSLQEAYKSVMQWSNSDYCLIVKFEDLVGIKGGGNEEAQNNTIQAIFSYLSEEISDTSIKRLGDSVFDTSSATFRKGHIEGWRSELSQDEIRTVNKQMADVLQNLSYV